MDTETIAVTRRTIFATAGLGGLAALALPSAAGAVASDRTPEEEANVKLVQDFITGWTKKDYDPNRDMAKYIASPCAVRVIDSQPAVTTPEAVAKFFADFMKDGSRIDHIVFHQVMARGKMVITKRDDIVKTPGKPDTVYKLVGVFVVKDGKIQEWTDFIVA